MLCPAAKGHLKANGLAGAARRISEAGGESIQSYERRMRVLNFIVVALIVPTILMESLSTAWMAFQKSLGLTFLRHQFPVAKQNESSASARQEVWA